MDKVEWREFAGLARDFCLTREVIDKVNRSMAYDEAHKILMEEYTKKWSK